MSCHVTWYHVVLTSLSCVTKFFYHTFFFHTLVWLLLSSCRYFKCPLILIITSYLSSYIVISKFFFLLLSSLLLQCCYTTLVVLWDCYGLVCDSLACVPSWNFVSKKSSRTFVIPARASLRSHAPAFMSPKCGISTHVSMLRMCQGTPRTHYARTRRAIPWFMCHY
jgi:hypothetical protein